MLGSPMLQSQKALLSISPKRMQTVKPLLNSLSGSGFNPLSFTLQFSLFKLQFSIFKLILLLIYTYAHH